MLTRVSDSLCLHYSKHYFRKKLLLVSFLVPLIGWLARPPLFKSFHKLQVYPVAFVVLLLEQ